MKTYIVQCRLQHGDKLTEVGRYRARSAPAAIIRAARECVQAGSFPVAFHATQV